ncbi:hypothetical protein ABVT39_002544 [Epinephelus coioides]
MCRRKRLRSAGEDDEEVRRCTSRPNPEGSLSADELSRYSKPEEEEEGEEGEELQRLCQRCHIMASQLNRQAAAMTDTTALKVSHNTTLSNTLKSSQRPNTSTDGTQARLRLIGCEVLRVERSMQEQSSDV